LSVLSFSSASLVASLTGSVVSEDVSPNDNEPNERVLNEGVVVGVVAKEKAGVVVGVVVVGVVVEAAFVSPGASLVSAVVSLSSLAGATSDLGFSTFRGTMHTVHEDAVSGLISVQQAHSHPSFLGAAAGMVNPALPNAGVAVVVEAVEDALSAGRDTMHTEHVDAVSGLTSVQQAHSHPSFLGAAAGMVNPALPKEGAPVDVANAGVGVVVPPENDGKEKAGVEEGVSLVSEESDSEPNEKVLVGVADAVVSVGLSSFLSPAGRERENAGVMVAAPAVAVVDGRKEEDVVGVGPVVVDSENGGGFSVALEEVEEASLAGSVAVEGLAFPPKDGKVKAGVVVAGVVEVVGVVEGAVVVVGVLLTVLRSGFDLAADFLEWPSETRGTMHTEQVEADSGFASLQHPHVHPSAEAGFTATPPKEMTPVGACVVVGGVVVEGVVVVVVAVGGLASSVLPPRLKAPPKENGSEDDEDGVDSEKGGTDCVVDVVSVVFGCGLLSFPLVAVLSFGTSASLD